MKIHICNAAIMPQAGYYHLAQIKPKYFFDAIREKSIKNIVSHIGYEANLDLIYEHSGKRLPLLRARDKKPLLEDGDTLYIMRLKRTKKIPNTLSIEDFDFFLGGYSVE